MESKTRLMLAGLAVALVAGSSNARAYGFEVREQSAVGQGDAFAGQAARNDDPSMISVNPAAMAGLPGLQGAVVGTGIFPTSEAISASGTRNALLGGSPIAGTPGGDLAVNAFVPSGYATYQVAPAWHVGISVVSPWGLTTENPPDAVSRYYGLTTSLRTINIAPAIAWQPTPSLALGAALQIQYATARLTTSVDFGSIGAAARLPFIPGSHDGVSTVTGSDTALGYVLGAQWEPLSGTRLGIAYHSAVFQTLNGNVSFQNVPLPLSLSPNFANGSAQSSLTTPETVTLGIDQRINERWSVLAGLEWTNWSRFKNLVATFGTGAPANVTVENWRDTIFASLGAEYRWNEKLSLRAGLAYDETPVQSAYRTPRIADNNRYWLAIGASYRVAPKVVLSAAYNHVWVPDAQVNLSDPGPNNTNLFRGNVRGTYRAAIDIVAAQVSFAL